MLTGSIGRFYEDEFVREIRGIYYTYDTYMYVHRYFIYINTLTLLYKWWVVYSIYGAATTRYTLLVQMVKTEIKYIKVMTCTSCYLIISVPCTVRRPGNIKSHPGQINNSPIVYQ